MLLSPLVPLVGVLVQGKLHLLSSLRPALTRRDHWELGFTHWPTHRHTSTAERNSELRQRGEHLWACAVTFMLWVINTVFYTSAPHTIKTPKSTSSPNSNHKLTALLSIQCSNRLGWKKKIRTITWIHGLLCRSNQFPVCRLNLNWLDGGEMLSWKEHNIQPTLQVKCELRDNHWYGAAGENETNKKAVYQSIAAEH